MDELIHCSHQMVYSTLSRQYVGIQWKPRGAKRRFRGGAQVTPEHDHGDRWFKASLYPLCTQHRKEGKKVNTSYSNYQQESPMGIIIMITVLPADVSKNIILFLLSLPDDFIQDSFPILKQISSPIFRFKKNSRTKHLFFLYTVQCTSVHTYSKYNIYTVQYQKAVKYFFFGPIFLLKPQNAD